MAKPNWLIFHQWTTGCQSLMSSWWVTKLPITLWNHEWKPILLSMECYVHVIDMFAVIIPIIWRWLMQSQEHCLDNLLTNPKLVKGQSGLSSNLGGEATPFTQNSDDLPIEAEDFPALQVCCFDSQSYIDAIFCWSILLLGSQRLMPLSCCLNSVAQLTNGSSMQVKKHAPKSPKNSHSI